MSEFDELRNEFCRPHCFIFVCGTRCWGVTFVSVCASRATLGCALSYSWLAVVWSNSIFIRRFREVVRPRVAFLLASKAILHNPSHLRARIHIYNALVSAQDYFFVPRSSALRSLVPLVKQTNMNLKAEHWLGFLQSLISLSRLAAPYLFSRSPAHLCILCCCALQRETQKDALKPNNDQGVQLLIFVSRFSVL